MITQTAFDELMEYALQSIENKNLVLEITLALERSSTHEEFKALYGNDEHKSYIASLVARLEEND